MKTRETIPEDAKRLAEVHVTAWQMAYRGIQPDEVLDGLEVARSEASWRRNLAVPSARRNLVCEVDGVVEGFVSFGPSRDEAAEPGRQSGIYGIYVSPDRWRQGLGRVLMEVALGELKAAGYREVELWVYEANNEARGFYERMGFRLVEGRTQAVERYGVAPLEVLYRWTLGRGRSWRQSRREE